jgi:ribosome-interacting GTPase 1
MMEFENIKIQLIDTPPLASQPVEYWLPHMLRRADALLVVVNLSDAPLAQMETITTQLEGMRIRIGEKVADDESGRILTQKKALILGNKVDLGNANENYIALCDRYQEQFPVIAVSAKERLGLEELRLRIFQVLDIIRVYTKAPGQKPDFNDPIILDRGSTLEDAASSVHKDFQAKLKYARVWGSGKHDGVMVKRDHVLQDGDIMELHI